MWVEEAAAGERQTPEVETCSDTKQTNWFGHIHTVKAVCFTAAVAGSTIKLWSLRTSLGTDHNNHNINIQWLSSKRRISKTNITDSRNQLLSPLLINTD